MSTRRPNTRPVSFRVRASLAAAIAAVPAAGALLPFQNAGADAAPENLDPVVLDMGDVTPTSVSQLNAPSAEVVVVAQTAKGYTGEFPEHPQPTTPEDKCVECPEILEQWEKFDHNLPKLKQWMADTYGWNSEQTYAALIDCEIVRPPLACPAVLDKYNNEFGQDIDKLENYLAEYGLTDDEIQDLLEECGLCLSCEEVLDTIAKYEGDLDKAYEELNVKWAFPDREAFDNFVEKCGYEPPIPTTTSTTTVPPTPTTSTTVPPTTTTTSTTVPSTTAPTTTAPPTTAPPTTEPPAPSAQPPERTVTTTTRTVSPQTPSLARTGGSLQTLLAKLGLGLFGSGLAAYAVAYPESRLGRFSRRALKKLKDAATSVLGPNMALTPALATPSVVAFVRTDGSVDVRLGTIAHDRDARDIPRITKREEPLVKPGIRDFKNAPVSQLLAGIDVNRDAAMLRGLLNSPRVAERSPLVR